MTLMLWAFIVLIITVISGLIFKRPKITASISFLNLLFSLGVALVLQEDETAMCATGVMFASIIVIPWAILGQHPRKRVTSVPRVH